MAKKEEWKEFVDHSAVSKKLTGNRSSIRSNYLDDKSRTKYRDKIIKLKNFINKWLDEL